MLPWPDLIEGGKWEKGETLKRKDRFLVFPFPFLTFYPFPPNLLIIMGKNNS